jgi:hypothetical protein
MHVTHIGLYDHCVNIAKKQGKSDVCFELCASITTKEGKSNVGFEPPCQYCKRGRKIQCVL